MNPYESPADAHPNLRAQPTRVPFPYASVGPMTGASVGLTHGVASLLAWTQFDRPDFLIRSAESTLAVTALLSLGGAVFGIFYALLLSLVCHHLNRNVRRRLHFVSATITSFLIAYGAAYYSLVNRSVVNPFLVLAGTVAMAFAIALLTSFRNDEFPGLETIG
ncbi:hypothetical protein NB063_29175 [Rhodopirellula sp. ICT_H3.1]|uniref:Uncharacterized protein n=1 Tax=Aporhodopirellula aestuarii TaxID=2950107 RepID=A0ABT0UCS1_9BACT|nr:hypothetical protein [Aporhodopirellula aestuarii]